MKLFLIGLSFFVTALALAQTQVTGGVQITGYIPEEYSIRVAASPTATNLAIQRGESNTKIASVVESSNSATGYSVRLSTRNGGYLVNNQNPSQAIPYQISYDGLPFVQPSTSETVVKRVPHLNDPIVYESQMRIAFQGNPSAPVGSYSDTIFLQISAP